MSGQHKTLLSCVWAGGESVLTGGVRPRDEYNQPQTALARHKIFSWNLALSKLVTALDLTDGLRF